MALTKATLIDLNSNELILDLDADTSITADTDDTIHFKIGGSDEITITTTALSPSTSDGNALGTAALEWADLFLADGAVISLGDDQDVTLTHVADTGVLLNSTNKIQFNDASQFIHGSSATVLSLGATAEIDLTATAIDINGTCDVSGAFTTTTITASGIVKTDDTTEATSTTDGSLQTDGGLSVAKDAVFGDDVKLLSDAAVLGFGADGDVTLTHVADTGVLLNSTMAIQFNDASQYINAPSNAILDINATDEIELNATLVDVNANLDVSGTIVAAGALTAATSITVGSAVLTEAELELLDGLTAGTAIASKVVTTDASIDTSGQRNLTITGELDAATGDFSGVVDVAGALTTAAITASGIIKTDDTTAATSTTDGSLQTDGGLSVAADAVIGDDVKLLSDAAVLGFGADQEVTLTHVHNVGLLLNSTMQLQFHDSSQYINARNNAILDIYATDEIELNSTLIDINGNVEISGTAVTTGVHTFTAVPVFPNNTVETADIQDNAVTLAKMAGGTDGNIISYDASGDPVAIATGSDGQVLTSTGAGSPPAFESISTTLGGLTDVSMDITNLVDGLIIQTNSDGSAPGTGTLSGATSILGIGKDVFAALTSGDDNYAYGHNALKALTTASANIAIGSNTLDALTTENYNIAIGHNSMTGSVNGAEYNVIVGNNAGAAITTGDSNTGVGHNALTANTTGTRNTAIGRDALLVMDGSDRNVAVGYESLKAHTTGNRNVAVGDGSGIAVIGGANNTLIGDGAGYSITTGDRNVVVGQGHTTATATDDNQLNIGGWIIGVAGQITIPNQPAFLAHAASSQDNIAINTATTIVFGTERFDVRGDFASNTFTAPVTGKYQLNCVLRLQNVDISADYMYVKIITSNRNHVTIRDHGQFNGDPQYWTESHSALADMDAGDTAYVQMYQAGGAAQMDIAGTSDGHTYFSGFLAC